MRNSFVSTQIVEHILDASKEKHTLLMYDCKNHSRVTRTKMHV